MNVQIEKVLEKIEEDILIIDEVITTQIEVMVIIEKIGMNEAAEVMEEVIIQTIDLEKEETVAEVMGEDLNLSTNFYSSLKRFFSIISFIFSG